MDRMFVIATKSGEPAGERWLQKLRNIPGVRVQGATPDQAVIVADERGIANVRALFGTDDFLIEEQIDRGLGR
jgi:hypothetical protein